MEQTALTQLVRKSLELHQNNFVDVKEIVLEIRYFTQEEKMNDCISAEAQAVSVEMPAVRKYHAAYAIFKTINLKFRQLPWYDKYISYFVEVIKAVWPFTNQDKKEYYRQILNEPTDVFLTQAYGTFLHSEPDPEGFEYWKHQLHESQTDRFVILGHLRFSREGMQYNEPFDTLYLKYVIHSAYYGLCKIPIVGYLVRWIKLLITMPRLAKTVFSIREDVYTQQQASDQLFSHYARALEESERRCNELAARMEQSVANQVSLLKKQMDGKVDVLQLDLLSSAVEKRWLTLKSELDTQSCAMAEMETILHANIKELKQIFTELESYQQKTVDAIGSLRIGQENTENSLKKMEETEKNIENRLLDFQAYAQEAIQSIYQQKEQVKQKLEEIRTLRAKSDAIYLDFENLHRGSREEIKKRLGVYGGIAKNLQDHLTDPNFCVLDIGCGRGEWLELLKELQIQAMGVDINSAMIELCTNRNLAAVQGDAIHYLTAQPAESYNMITGFQIVEHIDSDHLLQVLKETKRVLKPDGIAIFETPNPENLIVGACNFYMDPTHIRPIPPARLQFFAQSCGFKKVDILRVNPYGAIGLQDAENPSRTEREMAKFFNNEADYAIIAYK